MAGVARAGDPVHILPIPDPDISARWSVDPSRLPKDRDAPVTLHWGGTIGTHSGANPPKVREVSIELDRHFSLVTTGLPVCRRASLSATPLYEARKACPGAIIGGGFARFVVTYPERAPLSLSGQVALFNGPRKRGEVTIFAVLYATSPASSETVIPIAVRRAPGAIYDYRASARLSAVAGGYGVLRKAKLRIGRQWAYEGERYSLLNARCATGRLQSRTEFSLVDGTQLRGTFIQPCQVRR